jgi:hypothetical protein
VNAGEKASVFITAVPNTKLCAWGVNASAHSLYAPQSKVVRRAKHFKRLKIEGFQSPRRHLRETRAEDDWDADGVGVLDAAHGAGRAVQPGGPPAVLAQ